MRLYGKRFVANRTEGRISDRRESRDAVVYDIDATNRRCRVRVAGSNTLVRAWFPANFMRAPVWLKVGTAVRIAHVGGSKSRIEVISSGLIQPTQATSPMQGGVDTVLLGMYPTAPIDSTGWTVAISEGSYRIGGVSYLFAADGPTMNSPNWHMGDGGAMSGDYWWGSVDPMGTHDPDELWFRYDAFVIGIDGVIDYLKGDEWMWVSGGAGPTKPSVPSGHVLIRNYVLLWSGTPAISQANIGKEWAAPYPHHLDVTYAYTSPAYETDAGWARSQEGVGVIYGGPNVYVPASPGGPKRGSGAADMDASATISVMTQYNTPHSWWSSGSFNQLSFQWLGSAAYGGYGSASLGLGAGAIPPVTDESGFGAAHTVSLGLGASYSISYERAHSYVAQGNPAADGYPGYEQADSDSHTALIQVSLVSSDARNPVSTILTFYNLDSAGKVQ